MKEEKKGRMTLTLLLSGSVFLVTLVTLGIIGIVLLAADRLGLLSRWMEDASILSFFGIIALISLIGGTLLTVFLGTFPLRSINRMTEGLHRLASGDYKARIVPGKIPGSIRPIREMIDSFNTTAQELEGTEMLRSDFINSFSHEFKTPLVSIRGFARILQRGGLSEAQQQEYLSIIVDESTRLSSMATNVLSLSKVENQSILTDVSSYNLSEQLRRCILVLEDKWTAKGLVVEADFAEYHVRGNEEQLKQVWLNLVDNAVKFSPEGGEIRVDVCRQGAWLCVTVVNHGPAMTEEERRRAFDKFWQGDTSHAAEGTGIGLSVVKKIVELHRGNVDVDSSEEGTVFTVKLPAE